MTNNRRAGLAGTCRIGAILALASIAACAAAPARNGNFVNDIPGTEEENEAPPPCGGTPVEVAAAESRGVLPIDSKAALAAAVGSTVYVVEPKEVGPATKGGKRRWFRFGEPVVLCRAKPLRNPGVVVSEEVFYANNVLVKDRRGRLYSLPIEMLSRAAPRFSVDAPASAEETLLGAFSEAFAAKQALGEAGSAPPRDGGRDSEAFWADKAARALAATQRVAKGLVHRIVTSRPGPGHGTPPPCKVEGAECREDGTWWYAASADPHLEEWVLRGIDDGGQRDAYAKLDECLARGRACDEAQGLISSPVKPSGVSTVGGKLVITVRPLDVAAQATLEVDGQPAKLNGGTAEVAFEKDGTHAVTVKSAKGRTETRSSIVKEGRTVNLNVVVPPGP